MITCRVGFILLLGLATAVGCGTRSGALDVQENSSTALDATTTLYGAAFFAAKALGRHNGPASNFDYYGNVNYGSQGGEYGNGGKDYCGGSWCSGQCCAWSCWTGGGFCT